MRKQFKELLENAGLIDFERRGQGYVQLDTLCCPASVSAASTTATLPPLTP